MATSLDAVKSAAGIQKKPSTLEQAIERATPEFAKLLGNRMDPVRFTRIAYSQVKLNPKLAEDVPGLLTCIALAATLRLEPGVMGHCYFVPYGGKKGIRNQFITGWQGHVDLVTRANKATVRTLAVREGDEFDCDLGSKPFVHYRPMPDGDEDRDLIMTVAIGHVVNMTEFPQIEVWPMPRLVKHLNRYNKVGDRHYALSTGSKLERSHNFEMYARKIPLLQVVKYLPKSVEWQAAAELDYQADAGKQILNLQTAAAVINGEPVIDAVEDEQETQPAQAAIDPRVAKMNEIFGLLGWSEDVQARWISANASLTLDQQLERLERQLGD